MTNKLSEALEVLKNYQRQLDIDGVEVGVSREALEIVLADQQRNLNQFSYIISFLVEHGMVDHKDEYDLNDVIVALQDNYTPTVIGQQGQPRCWLLEEHFHDGTTRLQCFDYKLTVVPLYEPVGKDHA